MVVVELALLWWTLSHFLNGLQCLNYLLSRSYPWVQTRELDVKEEGGLLCPPDLDCKRLTRLLSPPCVRQCHESTLRGPTEGLFGRRPKWGRECGRVSGPLS